MLIDQIYSEVSMSFPMLQLRDISYLGNIDNARCFHRVFVNLLAATERQGLGRIQCYLGAVPHIQNNAGNRSCGLESGLEHFATGVGLRVGQQGLRGSRLRLRERRTRSLVSC